MNLTISSIADFDKSLLDEYERFVGYFPDAPESFIQHRFAQYGVFPKLGWALIGVGEAQALASKDPAFLYATIARFIKCAHGCWGPTDERGLHWGGYDFCSLVVPSLYSALLGKAYIASTFHCGRPISTNGYGAYKHAANLMVCLECNTWTCREKAIARARSFVSSNSNSKTDKAFVSYFMGVLMQDRTVIAEALSTFFNGYLKSDWGRHKPLTQPTFIQAMIAYAKCYLTDPVDSETHRSIVSGDTIELWQEFERNLREYQRNPHQFLGALSFLNEIAVR